MENALLIGLSRQIALGHQMTSVANNMANIGTSGYKAETLRFEEFLMPVAEVDGATGEEAGLHYVLDPQVIRHFETGSLRATGNPLDVALNGEGWFVVQTDAGDRYTRDGHFTLDPQGNVVNSAGQMILGEAGPFALAPGETDFTVAADGTVSTSAGEKGRLRVVAFENQALLEKEGQNFMTTDEPPIAAEDYTVAQGYLEDSNVQPVREIAEMIDVMRAYVSTSRQLEKLADLKDQAIEQLSRIEA